MTTQVEWNAEQYHEVSRPHEAWAARVLDRLPVSGVSTVIDAGCGTGKITRELLDRLPAATVYALDTSQSMLIVAERELAPDYCTRVRFLLADLAQVTPQQVGTTADLIFSTATFHWLRDHEALFRRLFDLLVPGGRLIAQCGGGPNIGALRERLSALMRSPQFAPYYQTWTDPWFFATADDTARRLVSAGYSDVETNVEFHPTPMGNEHEYRSFVSTVILRDHLARLPDDAVKTAFVDELTRFAATDNPPFELDYWRLNMCATRPI